jgi:GT2 family glycosyltransferase
VTARVHKPACAIVIPSYRGASLTRACVVAICERPPSECEWEIVIVDDGSEDRDLDRLVDEYDRVGLIRLEQNSGFAVACNTGAAAAGACDYLVFLNNDTLPVPGWLDALVREASLHPDAAAVGARLLFPNGTVQHAGVAIGRDGWPRHLYTLFPGEHPAVTRPKRVAAVTAACILVKRSEFAAAGGFDTAFLNGYEDVDLCLRLGASGQEIRYAPESVVYHLESVTRWPDGPEPVGENERLYDQRWRAEVEPDEFQHFLDDGVLSVEYGSHYPLTLRVSPYLATVRRDGDPLTGLEQLLGVRSREVQELMAAQIRSEHRDKIKHENGRSTARGVTAQDAELVAHGTVHRLGNEQAHRLVSVILPVKNQENDVRELLPLLLAQKAQADMEIIAVDSGSTDATVAELIRSGATVLSIDPADFNHGLTRDTAAAHAHGEVLLFLSGRSRPADDRWLAPLLKDLEQDPELAGVCSRMLPKAQADLLTRRDGLRELCGSSVRTRKSIEEWKRYRELGIEERRVFLNFHTVGSAIRADVFRQIPFQPVTTLGEDLLWAREVIEEGWALLHEPASVVYHSHDYTLRELLGRNVDDGLANSEIVGRLMDEQEILPRIEALVADDWMYLDAELQLEGEELRRWQVAAVLRRVAQVVGQWVGVNHAALPDELLTALSGVSQAKRKS